jgi:hypothetical protein
MGARITHQPTEKTGVPSGTPVVRRVPPLAAVAWTFADNGYIPQSAPKTGALYPEK